MILYAKGKLESLVAEGKDAAQKREAGLAGKLLKLRAALESENEARLGEAVEALRRNHSSDEGRARAR